MQHIRIAAIIPDKFNASERELIVAAHLSSMSEMVRSSAREFQTRATIIETALSRTASEYSNQTRLFVILSLPLNARGWATMRGGRPRRATYRAPVKKRNFSRIPEHELQARWP